MVKLSFKKRFKRNEMNIFGLCWSYKVLSNKNNNKPNKNKTCAR